MSTQNLQKNPQARWTTWRALTPTILFLIIAIITEYLIVLCAISLGVNDVSLLQQSFQLPGTTWNVTLSVSPLFHLVPIAAIIALITSWMYLKGHVAFKPQEIWRGKAGQAGRRGKPESKTLRTLKRFFGRVESSLSRVKGVGYLIKKTRFARAAVRSALAVLLLFALFLLVTLLVAYPQAIYRVVSGAYQANPSLLGFMKATGQALASLSAIGNAFTFAAPGFRDLALGFGGLISPLARLDNAGKYLVVQNAAAWFSALTALFYVEFLQQNRPYRKK